MSDYTAAVNRKQFFARLLIEKCAPESDPYGHATQALAESALFHLELAYRFHLKAVASDYKCPAPEAIATVEQLVAALEAIDKHPAEAEEMLNLEQDEQSWLFLLLKRRAQCLELDQAASQGIEKMGIPLQQLSSDDESDKDLSAARIKSWLSALEEMVNRHRALMIEC